MPRGPAVPRRRAIVGALALALAAVAMLYAAGDVLTRPASVALGPSPSDLGAETVELPA